MSEHDQDDDEKYSYSSKPLSSAQIVDAVNQSSDGGTTIFLDGLGVTEIWPRSAEELSAVGQPAQEGGMVERYFINANLHSSKPNNYLP
jgi:hypothetical protein